MTPTAPVYPRHHTWMGRHKLWTILLVVVALAILAGAILCNIY